MLNCVGSVGNTRINFQRDIKKKKKKAIRKKILKKAEKIFYWWKKYFSVLESTPKCNYFDGRKKFVCSFLSTYLLSV